MSAQLWRSRLFQLQRKLIAERYYTALASVKLAKADHPAGLVGALAPQAMTPLPLRCTPENIGSQEHRNL